MPLIDRWIFSRLARATAQVNDALEHFRFHEAAHVVYHFFWGDFCDWYIEWVKPELTRRTDEGRLVRHGRIFSRHSKAPCGCCIRSCRLSPRNCGTSCRSAKDRNRSRCNRSPAAKPEWIDDAAEKQLALLQEIVKAAREIRAELKLDPKKKVAADFATGDAATAELVRQNLDPVLRLAALTTLNISVGALDAKAGVIRSTAQFDVRIAYGEGVDKQAELARLRKEVDRLAKDIDSKKKRLSDEVFLSRAPEEIRRNLETTLTERESEHQKLSDRLRTLE